MGNNMSKTAVLMLFALLTLSSLIMVGFAFAQSIPKPSVPEFTLELVGPPYSKNTTYSLDPNTGQVVAEIGYTNPYSVLKINVKNQPFDSSYGNLYYNVRVKNHSATDDWIEAYRVSQFFPSQSNDSDYTNVGFSIHGYNFIGTLAGCQVDIQVEAMLGVIGRVSTSPPIGGYGFIGETSGWSETQAISISENTPLNPVPTSPTPIPHEVPEPTEQEVILGAVITVTVLGAGLGLLIYLIKRK
jgi:hypothetical protein